MSVTAVYLSDLHDAVIARLKTVGGFPATDVYDGEVESDDPDVEAPRLIPNSFGKIQPYIVVWSAPGASLEQPLCGPDGSAEHYIHATVAASTPGRCMDAADRARRFLDGAWFPVGGHDIGVLWLPGYKAPPVQRDPDVSPARWFCPLIFTALI